MTKQERATMEIKRAEDDKKLRAIQIMYDMLCHPNSAYDLGFVNGLAMVLAILTEQPPKYIHKSSGDII